MGFTFTILFLFLFWPLLLGVWLLELLNMALPVIFAVLLVWNLLVLAVLLVVRHLWRASGTMDRAYIDALGGWKRVVLLILRYGLLVFLVWEALLVLGCAAGLIWRPDLLAILSALCASGGF